MLKYMTPKEIKEKAKKEGLIQLESQAETVDAIASVLSKHLLTLEGMKKGMQPDEFPPNSMLVISRTGNGKSELLKRLSKASGLPFAIVDSSSLTAEGFKGINVSQAVHSAIQGYSDPSAFEQLGGVILFDEFDKISFDNNHYDVNPQPSFLKLIEKDTPLRVDLRSSDVTTINTSKLLFVFAGAFQRLETSLRSKRFRGDGIGFLAKETNKATDCLKSVTMSDIAAHGFLSELLGRIGRLQYIPPLSEEDYIALIKGAGNSWQQKYANLFDVCGVKFSVSDAACVAIGRQANEDSLGARSISPILDKLLQPAFSRVCEDPEITSVSVVNGNGGLTVHYKKVGTRGKDIIAEKKTNWITAINESFSSRISNERGIAVLVTELSAKAKLKTDLEETAFRYFLQFILRYLYLECNVDDQVYMSLIKLSKCISLDPDEGESVMDILVSDAVKRRPNRSGDKKSFSQHEYDCLNHMQNFYTLFKNVASPTICKRITSELERIESVVA